MTTYSTTTGAPGARNRARTMLTWMLWPLAIVLIIHRSWVLPHQSGATDDFTTVWRALVRFADGVKVYTANYDHVDPHYLYSPGGTLALQPVTWLGDYDTARMWFIFAQAAGIIGAILLALRFLGVRLTSWCVPLVLSLAFLTESVTSTLRFANVNGTLLLAMVVFIVLVLRDRPIAAGLVLGLAITVKPIVAPLLFIPFVRRNWSAIIASGVVPLLFNAAAWPLAADPWAYLERTIPYMGEVRLYANASITGQLHYYGASEPLTRLWLIVLAVPVIASLILLLRWQWRDGVFWALSTSGVLMTGVMLLGTLGQQYYSLLLMPAVLGIFHALVGPADAQGDPPRSVALNAPAGLGITLFYFSLDWFMDDYHVGSEFWIQIMATTGWLLFSLTMFGVLLKWTIEEHGAGYDWLGRKGATSFFGTVPRAPRPRANRNARGKTARHNTARQNTARHNTARENTGRTDTGPMDRGRTDTERMDQ